MRDVKGRECTKAIIPSPQRDTGRPYTKWKNQATAVNSGDARNMEAKA